MCFSSLSKNRSFAEKRPLRNSAVITRNQVSKVGSFAKALQRKKNESVLPATQYFQYIDVLSLCLQFCSIAITSLGEERAGVCAFRAFVCFRLFGLRLFPLPLGVKVWLRPVIVVFPGLFFYLFGKIP